MRESKNQMTLLGAVRLLNLDCNTNRASTYIACPICDRGKRKKRMNLNFATDEFRCAKCGSNTSHTQGGPVSFWMLMTGIDDPKEAARDYYRKAGDGAKVDVVKRDNLKKEHKEPKVAPVDVRDHTYTLLLQMLPLRKRHAESLRARGLSDRQIKEFCYKSTPSDPKATAKKLRDMGATLQGVPGFYVGKDGLWTMSDYGSGILIPQRNSKGQIQGFQIRRDEKQPICRNCSYFEKGICTNEKSERSTTSVNASDTCSCFKEYGSRYLAFSSRDKKEGTPAQTYVHYREGVKGCEDMIITEGALKADVISSLSGYSVLSVPGVNSLKFLPQALRSLLKKDLCRVIVAYDMDKRDNEQVQQAERKLTALLKHLEIPYQIKSWDPRFKGLDDWLLSEKKKKQN